MLDRAKLLDLLKAGKQVTVDLVDAEVVFAKAEMRPICHYKVGTLMKIIVRDEKLGSIYFGGFSDKLRGINRGDRISLKVKVTGIGDASEKYPDPILFSKPLTRKGDSVKVGTPETDTSGNDLSINV